MAASSYDDALARLLVHEGGYTNHPADPGGPTNFGITIYDYRKYVKPDATAADVRAMKLSEAKGIYRAKYWDAQRCDELPAGVDYAVFDYGVNSGIGRSGKVLRRVLKIADNTGVIADTVIAAAHAADAKALIVAICDERLRFLQGLRTWGVFGAGWGRRVAEVRSVALAMAAGAPSPDLGRTHRAGPRHRAACQICAARFGRRNRRGRRCRG
jgi:lysozyme family protein